MLGRVFAGAGSVVLKPAAMRNPDDLNVFRLSDALALDVFRVVCAFPGGSFPAEERYGVCAQIRRAAVSIPSNIAEGCSRKSQRDFARFVEIARGSAMELRYQLSLCRRLGWGPTEDVRRLEAEADRLCKALAGLAKTLD